MDDPKYTEIEALKDEHLINTWETRYQGAIDTLKRVRLEWMKNFAFVMGDHWQYYNTTLKKLVPMPRRRKDEVRLTINVIYYILRAIRGYVMSYEPRHDVEPMGLNPENLEIANRTARLLTWNWEANSLNRRCGDAAFDALWSSVSGLLCSWNADKQMVEYKRIDPFDLFWDTTASDTYLNDCKYIGYVFEPTEDDLKDNPNWTYNKDEMFGEDNSKDRYDGIKDFVERRILKKDVDTNKDEVKRLLGREVYYKKLIDNTEGGKDEQIWVMTWLKGAKKPLRNEPTDYPEYPIKLLHSDTVPGQLYGSGWVKNLIPLQKAINLLESRRLEFINRASKYVILNPKNNGIKEIHDISGLRLDYNPMGGFNQPRPLQQPGLPADLQNQVTSLMSMVQKIAGVHDQFLGMPGFAGESGRHAESMQAASARNQAEFVQNMQHFIGEVGMFTLWLYEKYLATPIIFQDKDIEGNEVYTQAVGVEEYQRRKQTGDHQDLLPIIYSKVKVKVGTQLAYTDDARFERAMELYDRQLVDRQFVLETLGVGNVAPMLERLKLRETQKAQQPEMEQQGEPIQQQEQNLSTGTAPVIEEVGAEVAQQETEAFLAGQIEFNEFINGTPNAGLEHTEAHMQIIASGMLAGLDDESMGVYVEHIKAEAEQNGAINSQEVQELVNATRQF